jgi:hypothetical protein
MRTSRLLAVPSALAAIALTAVPGAPPAFADKPAEPAESGVVERGSAIGGHQVGPVMTDVGGEMRPVLVAVGWDDAVTYCSGGPPVFNGVGQVVVAPSGHVSTVVHNSDIPILVFDVSGADNGFFEKCAAGEIVPLATGTAKQRPIVHETESAANVKAKTRGVVTDATGQDWTMQAFTKFRVDFGAGEPQLQVLKEWVKLTAL